MSIRQKINSVSSYSINRWGAAHTFAGLLGVIATLIVFFMFLGPFEHDVSDGRLSAGIIFGYFTARLVGSLVEHSILGVALPFDHQSGSGWFVILASPLIGLLGLCMTSGVLMIGVNYLQIDNPLWWWPSILMGGVLTSFICGLIFTYFTGRK